MPLITEYREVKDTYQEARELGVGLPAFCAEDRETLEAILASALEMGSEIGVDDLPVIPAWTSRYPARGQMTLVAACGDPILGTQLMFSDLEAFMGETSPYRKLRVLPHLDHAFPWLDGDVLEGFLDRFASVMCDASEKPFDENIRLTARYVEKVKGRVVVEGAADEIFEAGRGGQKNEPTTVGQVREFMSRAGVDLVVPNVGTEHRAISAARGGARRTGRATAEEVEYRSDRAREISAAVGKVLCLHGTSSLGRDQLHGLSEDGFIKINIYTTLAVAGGQALALKVLSHLGNIFSEARLKELVQEGVLGEKTLAPEYSGTFDRLSAAVPSESKGGGTRTPVRLRLDCVANPPRRDAWFRAVRDRCREFLEALGYIRYRSSPPGGVPVAKPAS